MRRGIPAPLLRLANGLRQAYWKVFKPRTFGVKVLVLHPDDSGRFLLVQHSYGDRDLWSLPGGGYRPRRESAEDAARRECREELGIELRPSVAIISEHVTSQEGKLDHLVILRGQAVAPELSPNSEVAATRWAELDLSALPEGWRVSQWARAAIATVTK
ncbi:NUDIX domain-containing protein [Longispora albida]|uniref:NUDIX domain-containing protein n=1 Tax=Longispora albida TaxID=203523 RepID=UPI000476759C|nr:NUDIX domain-containing protein [Longispora albida]